MLCTKVFTPYPITRKLIPNSKQEVIKLFHFIEVVFRFQQKFSGRKKLGKIAFVTKLSELYSSDNKPTPKE